MRARVKVSSELEDGYRYSNASPYICQHVFLQTGTLSWVMTGPRSELFSITEYSFLGFSLIQTSPSRPTYIIFSCFSVQNPVNDHGCHVDVLPPLSSLIDDRVSAPRPHSLFFSSMTWCEESRPGVPHHGAQLASLAVFPHGHTQVGSLGQEHCIGHVYFPSSSQVTDDAMLFHY